MTKKKIFGGFFATITVAVAVVAFLSDSGDPSEVVTTHVSPDLEIVLAAEPLPIDNREVDLSPMVCKDLGNGIYFSVLTRNQTDSKTGPLKFVYYLDQKLPKPESSMPSNDPDYGYELSGGIHEEGGGSIHHRMERHQNFGVFFGPDIRLYPGKYKFKISIFKEDDTCLYTSKFIGVIR